MKKRIIILGVIALVLAFAGCGSQTYLTPYTPGQTSTAATVSPAYQNSTTTTLPPASTVSNKVIITYSAVQAAKIGAGSYPSTPKAGNVYEIVTYTITNSASISFSVNPFYFDIIVSNIKYGYSSDSYYLPNSMDSVEVMKGGTLTCSLAFEIPAASSSFTPTYEDMFGYYTIQWLAQ